MSDQSNRNKVSEPEHADDCDCHDCWQIDLRAQFNRDAMGTRPYRGEGLAQ